MHLSLIHERRYRPDVRHVFRGTKTLARLVNALNHGLGGQSTRYFGSLPTALAYSLDWWGHGGRDPGDVNAYVYEVAINANDQSIRQDEDVLALSRGVPGDDSSDADWFKYLNSIAPNQAADKHQQLKNAIITYQQYGDIGPIKRLASTMRLYPHQWIGSVLNSAKYNQNIATARPIGLRGRTRIVGAYVFAPIGDRRYQCIRNLHQSPAALVKVADVVTPVLPSS